MRDARDRLKIFYRIRNAFNSDITDTSSFNQRTTSEFNYRLASYNVDQKVTRI